MTPQEILEGNKLLAEFMGYVNTTPADPDFNIYENSSGEMLEAMSMKYHSSWDWLIPLVTKIMDYCFENDGTEDLISNFYDIRDTIPDIQRTWCACVEFIKWYNQNKTTSTKPCPNCNETEQPCACMRNICHKCGKPVGNITFTVCDECWDKD